MQLLCARHGLVYKSVGGWEANCEIMRTLHKAAVAARAQKVVAFRESVLYAGMHAQG